jgi:hypothetical protein
MNSVTLLLILMLAVIGKPENSDISAFRGLAHGGLAGHGCLVLGRSADHSTGGEMTFVVFLVGVLVVALSVAAFAWLSARPRAKRL